MQFNIVGFSYDIPFPLMLPDSSFLVNLGTSQLCIIRVQVRLGKTEFVTEKALKEKRTWGDPKCKKAIVTTQNEPGDEMAALDVLIDETSRPLRYLQDKGYSNVEVVLQIPDSEDPEAYRENNTDHASEILSHFLLGYRMYSNDHLIPDFRPEDVLVIGASIGTCTVVRAGKVGDITELEIKYSNNKPTFQWEDIGRHIKSPLAEDRLSAFETWLQDNRPILEHQRLLLMATERGIRQKDFSTAVIFAQTAFEVFVSYFIKQRAALLNITQLPLNNGKIKPVVEALEKSFLKHILREFVPRVTSSTIVGMKEYNNWDTHAYKLRNEIVHAGRIVVSESEAKKAFESVVALIAKLEALP